MASLVSSPSGWTSHSDTWSQTPHGISSHHSSPFLKTEPDNMSDRSPSIQVAIIGGDLAAIALLRGLLHYPHVSVDLYEARPQFKEDGPAIDLSENTQGVLRAIDPALDFCLDRAGAVYTSTELRIGTGSNTGYAVDVAGATAVGSRSVGRQALLAEMLADVPAHLLHLNTHIASIDEASGGYGMFLTFVDGSQKYYDAVVGADGPYGVARRFVVGSGDEARKPKSAGYWGLPVVVPLETARQAMGDEYLDPQNPYQLGWIGNGTLMHHGYLNHGRDVQITLFAKLDGSRSNFEWAKLFTPEELERIFSHNQSAVCQGMIRLVQSVYTIQIAGIVQTRHVHTPTYAHGNACLLGDTAHAGVTFNSAASSLSMEEALMLCTLLGRASSRLHVSAALQAYDYVCRPRADHVLPAASEAGRILLGKSRSAGLDPARLSAELEQKRAAINHVNFAGLQTAAIDTMDQLLSSNGW